MIAASRAPEFIDALVAVALATFAADQVFDGPDESGTSAASFIRIGSGPADENGWQVAARGSQDFAWLGDEHRRESQQVPCRVVGVAGSGDQKEARDAAYAFLRAFVAAVDAAPTLGRSSVWSVGVTSSPLMQRQGDRGAEARLDLVVSYVS